MEKELLNLILSCAIQEEYGKANVQQESYKNRILKIKGNRLLKETFSAGEIACSLFSIDLALQNLTDQQFDLLIDVYESYLFNEQALCLNYQEFLDYCAQVIESYDAVAPYEKISSTNTSL